MGTLADKLQYLKETKDAIMNAIIEKGVAITSSDTFRSYADKIKGITSGGGEVCTYYNNFTGKITSYGTDNIVPSTVVNALNVDNNFSGLLKINDENSTNRLILDTTFNTATDDSLEIFIHYKYNSEHTRTSGFITVGEVRWKSLYICTTHYASDNIKLTKVFGYNGSSWLYDIDTDFNIAEHPEFYIKFTIAKEKVVIDIYDTDKTTLLFNDISSVPTVDHEKAIILFNNWDIYNSGANFADSATIDLSDSYIIKNGELVQGKKKADCRPVIESYGGILCNINYGGYTTTIDNVKNNISATVLTIDNLTDNIVGSPTNDNGILSNFTDSDYVLVSSYVGTVPLGHSIYVKFKHNTTSWTNSIEHIFSREGIFGIETYYDTLTTYNWTSGVTTTILDNFEQDTWYYAVIKVGSDTSTGHYDVDYYLSKVSYDDALANGSIFTKQETYNESGYDYGMYFGRHCTISWRNAKDIAIDFNETYIKNPDGSYYLQFRQTEKLI